MGAALKYFPLSFALFIVIIPLSLYLGRWKERGTISEKDRACVVRGGRLMLSRSLWFSSRRLMQPTPAPISRSPYNNRILYKRLGLRTWPGKFLLHPHSPRWAASSIFSSASYVNYTQQVAAKIFTLCSLGPETTSIHRLRMGLFLVHSGLISHSGAALTPQRWQNTICLLAWEVISILRTRD